MAMPDDEILAERLLAEEGDMVVVESKMVRGSTHNKDRTTFVSAVSKDNFAEEVADLRDMQKLDMSERAAYDPENPGEKG
jgi:hypothetical protein